jgi:hypothetical protein
LEELTCDRKLSQLRLQDYQMPRKIAIIDLTPQPEILDLGHLICLDTDCANGGKLTAMEMGSGEVWQATATQCRKPLVPSHLYFLDRCPHSRHVLK